MKKQKKYLLPIFLLIFSGSIFGDEDNFRKLLVRLKERFGNIKDYQCIFESYTSVGKKSEAYTYRYFYSKPGLVRMEVAEGKRKGTVLLYDGQKVKLRLNKGLLSIFTLTFKPHNKKVCDIRGHGLDHSDWGWLIDKHLEILKLFKIKFVGKETIEGKKIMIYELISKSHKKTESVAREKIWIDTDNNIIVQYRQFDISNNLLQSSVYRDIVLNPGLDKKIFANIAK